MADSLTLHPLKLNALDGIDELDPIDRDHACLAELRDVLVKHGCERRLGIALLHKHFDLRADEVLLERCDSANRTLTMRPVKRSELGLDVIQTLWQVEGNGMAVTMGCSSFCPIGADGKHYGYKDHYDTDNGDSEGGDTDDRNGEGD